MKMRSEQQMMNLIMDTVKNDQLIRAVIVNGSRANPNAKKDFFQDFDIIFVVTSISSFVSDHSWIRIFGDIMIMQMPKSDRLISDIDDGSFTYLMQFTDGNRIDLSLVQVDKISLMKRESQSLLLLDKDGIVEPFPPASDSDFIVKQPTEKIYNDCCNEFWWICTYVAKGIWRDELPYAMCMYDRFLRDMLFKMISWYIGIKTDFAISVGKCGKHFKKYLEAEVWDMYLKTYCDSNYENLWKALFTAGNLFRVMAEKVADQFGFIYPYSDDRRVTAHLNHVRELPKTATEMYP